MFALLRFLIAPLVVLFLCGQTIAQEKQLTSVEIAKVGKASTALVEIKPRYAAAFCVHASGLFITNEHVVRQAGDASPITLVIDPSLKSQKVLRATVVRRDAKLDLALLRVEGEHNVAALELGSDDDLTELTELIAFGYPFGPALAVENGVYPAVSVSAGRVTSLRRAEGGVLSRIQLDAVLNPGNSGGPVFDHRGQVVGVVVGGVQGSGVNLAIPVSHVRRFLARPELRFTPPKLQAGKLHEPVAFEAGLVTILPGEESMEMELVLSVEGTKDRKLAMERKGDKYVITAPAVEPRQGPPLVGMQATYASGSITGSVEDRPIKIGEETVQLASVRLINFDEKPTGQLTDGRSLSGILVGLDQLNVLLGDTSVALDLSKARSARFEPHREIASLTYALVVRQDGKEIHRVTDSLPVAGADTSPPLTRSSSPMQQKVVRQLPSTVSDVAVGGGGRYLILFLPKNRQLAVFDSTKASIVKYLPMPEDTVKFTAGQNSLIVALPAANAFLRYNLTSFEREAIVPSPFKGTIQSICMGAASAGPLLVHVKEESGNGFARNLPRFLNPETFKPIEAQIDPQRGIGGGSFDYRAEFRASPNGKTFAMWRLDISPQGLHTLEFRRNTVEAKYEHSDAGYLIPGPDGRTLFTFRGLYSLERLKPMRDDPKQRQPVLPAASGNFYAAFARDEGNAVVNIGVAGDEQPLVQLKDMEGLAKGDTPPGNAYYPPDPFGSLMAQPGVRDSFSMDKRFHVLPEAKLIVVIPTSNDRLLLHSFDIDDALKQSGRDFLVTVSQPPLVAFKGMTYTYPIQVKSKRGDVKYKLEASPTGMTVAADGTITWPVPTGFVEMETNVIVNISDAGGQERLHSFTLAVRAPEHAAGGPGM